MGLRLSGTSARMPAGVWLRRQPVRPPEGHPHIRLPGGSAGGAAGWVQARPVHVGYVSAGGAAGWVQARQVHVGYVSAGGAAG